MHDLQDVSKKTLFFESLIHTLKGNIGAGLFAMGDAFKNSGYVLGIFGTLIIGLICVYNNHILTKLSRSVKEHKNLVVSPTFAETISYSFELGPPCFSRAQHFVMSVMKCCIIITQLGFCVIYIVFVSSTLQTIISNLTDYDMNVRWYMVATFIPVLAVSLIHTLKFLAPVSAISIIFMAYGFGVSLIVSAMDLPSIAGRAQVASYETWPLFLGTVVFSFEGIALVIPLKNEMKNPEKFDSPFGVMNIAMVIVMNLLISLGFVSYWRFGDKVSGSVTFDLPSNWATESARILVGLGILLTYPLQFYVPVKLFFKDMNLKWGPFRYPLLVEMLMRVALVILTYIFAMAIPHVNLIVSLIGAVCSNALALFFPAVADVSLRLHPISDDEKVQKVEGPILPRHPLRFCIDGISIILSVLGAVFGAYISVRDIVNEIHKDLE